MDLDIKETVNTSIEVGNDVIVRRVNGEGYRRTRAERYAAYKIKRTRGTRQGQGPEK